VTRIFVLCVTVSESEAKLSLNPHNRRHALSTRLHNNQKSPGADWGGEHNNDFWKLYFNVYQHQGTSSCIRLLRRNENAMATSLT